MIIIDYNLIFPEISDIKSTNDLLPPKNPKYESHKSYKLPLSTNKNNTLNA